MGVPLQSNSLLLFLFELGNYRYEELTALPSTRSLSSQSGDIRHEYVRSGTVFGTVRLILHSSRAVTVGAVKAPRYGGGHVTGFVGVDSKSSTLVPAVRARRDRESPRALRHGVATMVVEGPTP